MTTKHSYHTLLGNLLKLLKRYAILPLNIYDHLWLLITKYFRFPCSEITIPRQQESIATDTIYDHTPDIYCRHTIAQFYWGKDSQVYDVYGMKTEK